MTGSESRALVDEGDTTWSHEILDRGRPFAASSAAESWSATATLALDAVIVRAVRRIADIVAVVVGLVLMAPLLLAVLVAIKLDSQGPALFRQRRVGRDGAVFTMIKFRTMYTDAEQRLHELEACNEAAGGVLFKMKADPRVTRVGSVLRRCNLDEIPQLLNVFWGDMSLVGPRPLPLRDSQLLSMHQPSQYQARLAVRPGITGEWQIRRGGDSDYRHMLDLDMEYLRRRSLRHDAVIAVKTVWILLRSIVRR